MAVTVSYAMRRHHADSSYNIIQRSGEDSSLAHAMRYADGWLYGSSRGPVSPIASTNQMIVLCTCTRSKRSSKNIPHTCKKCKGTRLPAIPVTPPYSNGTVRGIPPTFSPPLLPNQINSKFGTTSRRYHTVRETGRNVFRNGTTRSTVKSRPSIFDMEEIDTSDPYDLMRRSRLVSPSETVRLRTKSISPSRGRTRKRSVSPPTVRSRSANRDDKNTLKSRKSILDVDINPYELMSTNDIIKDFSDDETEFKKVYTKNFKTNEPYLWVDENGTSNGIDTGSKVRTQSQKAIIDSFYEDVESNEANVKSKTSNSKCFHLHENGRKEKVKLTSEKSEKEPTKSIEPSRVSYQKPLPERPPRVKIKPDEIENDSRRNQQQVVQIAPINTTTLTPVTNVTPAATKFENGNRFKSILKKTSTFNDTDSNKSDRSPSPVVQVVSGSHFYLPSPIGSSNNSVSGYDNVSYTSCAPRKKVQFNVVDNDFVEETICRSDEDDENAHFYDDCNSDEYQDADSGQQTQEQDDCIIDERLSSCERRDGDSGVTGNADPDASIADAVATAVRDVTAAAAVNLVKDFDDASSDATTEGPKKLRRSLSDRSTNPSTRTTTPITFSDTMALRTRACPADHRTVFNTLLERLDGVMIKRRSSTGMISEPIHQRPKDPPPPPPAPIAPTRRKKSVIDKNSKLSQVMEGPVNDKIVVKLNEEGLNILKVSPIEINNYSNESCKETDFDGQIKNTDNENCNMDSSNVTKTNSVLNVQENVIDNKEKAIINIKLDDSGINDSENSDTYETVEDLIKTSLQNQNNSKEECTETTTSRIQISNNENVMNKNNNNANVQFISSNFVSCKTKNSDCKSQNFINNETNQAILSNSAYEKTIDSTISNNIKLKNVKFNGMDSNHQSEISKQIITISNPESNYPKVTSVKLNETFNPEIKKTVLKISSVPVHRLTIKNEFTKDVDNQQQRTSILINGDDCYSTMNVNDDIPLYQSSVVVNDSIEVNDPKTYNNSSTVYVNCGSKKSNTVISVNDTLSPYEDVCNKNSELSSKELSMILRDPVEAVKRNLVPHVCGKSNMPRGMKEDEISSLVLAKLLKDVKLESLVQGIENKVVAKVVQESLRQLKLTRFEDTIKVEEKDSLCSDGESLNSGPYEQIDNPEDPDYNSSNRSSLTEDELASSSIESKFYQLLAEGSLENDEHQYESVRINQDPIYEEIEIPPPLPLNPPPDTLPEDNLKLDKSFTTRSIFEGASKYDILSYLVDARERGIESYAYSFANSGSVVIECDNEVLPTAEDVQKGTVEVERTDSGVGSESSKSSRSRYQQNGTTQENSNPCEDCESPVDMQITTGEVVYAPLVCRKCAKRRAERKEIITEIVETEEKYARDLQIVLEEFYQPMLVAGLLNAEQLGAVFLNVEELLENSQAFGERLRESLEISIEQGDEDLLTMDVGRLFLDTASMFPSFESYCIRQAAAGLLLANLEKEKELLRIFLKVSQMENTVLRRMNLNSFLMVPVQRVTKYPLLLSRLNKVTPPHLEEMKELLAEAQRLVEYHLGHMNASAKDVPSRLWRRLSSGRRNTSELDSINIKLRKLAVDVLEWNHEEARFAMEGKLLYTQPIDSAWRRARTIKLTPICALLVTIGRPGVEYKCPDEEMLLAFPRQTGVREAALVLARDKGGRYSLLREPLYLDRCVIATDPAWQSYFEIQEIVSKDTFIFKAEDDSRTTLWYRHLQCHAQGMGSWRKRRNGLANIMITGISGRS